MVVALVISWDTASWSLKALRQRTDDSLTARRTAVTAAVAGLVQPRF